MAKSKRVMTDNITLILVALNRGIEAKQKPDKENKWDVKETAIEIENRKTFFSWVAIRAAQKYLSAKIYKLKT